MKKKINPAILVETFSELEKEVDALLQVTNEFDIDLIDWKRTKLKTLKVIEAIELNRFAIIHYDVMMDDARETVHILIESKTASRIIVNMESDYAIQPLLNKIKEAGIQTGISLNPENTAKQAIKYFPYVDFIQIMTIEPGLQGNPFIESRLGLSIELRELGYEGMIGVDGGVDSKTIPIIKKYPIDTLSIGSSFSRAPDPSFAYKNLMEIFTS